MNLQTVDHPRSTERAPPPFVLAVASGRAHAPLDVGSPLAYCARALQEPP
jgi:hypothetical protein